MLLWFTPLILFFIILIIFAFPQLSPIPYFPSNKKDLPVILKALDLKNSQTVFDLGAGDGRVIFNAAAKAYRQKLNTQFIATEINPILIIILHLRRLFHTNKKNIKIIRANMFNMNFSLLTTNYSLQTTFYLYISPWYLEKTINNIRKQIKNFRLVSYMYPVRSLENNQKILQGVNKVFVYNVEEENNFKF